jgi:hypothetical protein
VTDTWRLLGQDVEPGSGRFDSERSEPGCDLPDVTSSSWPLTEPPSIEAAEGGFELQAAVARFRLR